MRKRDGHFVNFCTLTPFFLTPFFRGRKDLDRGRKDLNRSPKGMDGVPEGRDYASIPKKGAYTI